MNKLFRSSSSVSSRSSMSSIPPIPDFINQEEHSYENISQELGNWNIPSVNQNKFMSQRLLITLKQTIMLKLLKEFMLLTKNMKIVLS